MIKIVDIIFDEILIIAGTDDSVSNEVAQEEVNKVIQKIDKLQGWKTMSLLLYPFLPKS